MQWAWEQPDSKFEATFINDFEDIGSSSYCEEFMLQSNTLCFDPTFLVCPYIMFRDPNSQSPIVDMGFGCMRLCTLCTSLNINKFYNVK